MMNPGSQEAIAAGCKCPRIDNGHGKRSDGRWVFNRECPVHGQPQYLHWECVKCGNATKTHPDDDLSQHRGCNFCSGLTVAIRSRLPEGK